MSNIDFKEMKKWMENQTEEDWERMREEHEVPSKCNEEEHEKNFKGGKNLLKHISL